MPSLSAYELVLGEEWPDLHEILRVAHSAPLRARGRANVLVGRFMVPLVQILKLPKRGKDQEVFLTVEHCGERLLWKRTFGIQEWNSEQTFEAGVMEERFGSTALRFQVSAVPDQITYRLVGFKLGKTTMPKFLSPRVEAEVTLEGTGWHVSVRTYALIFGLIHEYEAWLTAE